jgi:hypothetical protein
LSATEGVANTTRVDSRAWRYDAGFDAAWEPDIWDKLRRRITLRALERWPDTVALPVV